MLGVGPTTLSDARFFPEPETTGREPELGGKNGFAGFRAAGGGVYSPSNYLFFREKKQN